MRNKIFSDNSGNARGGVRRGRAAVGYGVASDMER
jgi:hypothetical protein